MSVSVARRKLFSRLRGGPPQFRPPWSREEETFTERCTQCGFCITACPHSLITTGHAGYPIVDFSVSGCTFCAACADACEDDCFLPAEAREGPAWPLVAVVGDACVETKGVACRLCEPVCDAEAILFRPRPGGRSAPLIDGETCTGCGACISQCPVGALTMNQYDLRGGQSLKGEDVQHASAYDG